LEKEVEKEIKKELNEFIIDIAKLLPGSDGIGYDGISWSIDDFKNAIKEVREDQTLKCAEAVKEIKEDNHLQTNSSGDILRDSNGDVFQKMGHLVSTGVTFKSKAITVIMETIEDK